MGEYLSYLITLLYEGRTLKVALCVHQELLTENEKNFPVEYQAEFERFLPLHAKYPIIDIVQIFDSIFYKEVGE